jgi:hypothetical protein
MNTRSSLKLSRKGSSLPSKEPSSIATWKTPFKHRNAEIHATSLKRLSKTAVADDPTDAAGDE